MSKYSSANKEDMEKTLIQQNPQWNGKPFKGLTERSIIKNLLAKKDLPHIQILTGVRRCGKSTLFKLLMNDLLASGVSPKSKIGRAHV